MSRKVDYLPEEFIKQATQDKLMRPGKRKVTFLLRNLM
uniref:Uncharacterized protein n=1 Tax=Klebsiella pneumoniae TaxID=573 RepID=A0A8E6L8I5_KLEPN|nr:hypothetical protein [Klebsiella pneumoniae]